MDKHLSASHTPIAMQQENKPHPLQVRDDKCTYSDELSFASSTASEL